MSFFDAIGIDFAQDPVKVTFNPACAFTKTTAGVWEVRFGESAVYLIPEHTIMQDSETGRAVDLYEEIRKHAEPS